MRKTRHPIAGLPTPAGRPARCGRTNLQRLYAARADKGLKSPAEDEMVSMYAHATFNLNPHPSSIDTPLHIFIPHPQVDHTHPNAAISVAAYACSIEATREIYGDWVVHIPWMRPGFELGWAMQEASKRHPEAQGFIMGQHGLINSGKTGRECYERTLELIGKAAAHIEKKQAGHPTVILLPGLGMVAFGKDKSESRVTAEFYADRTLTRLPITPADQAEAYYLLLTDKLSKTTGQIITVDGGLHEAFLRSKAGFPSAVRRDRFPLASGNCALRDCQRRPSCNSDRKKVHGQGTERPVSKMPGLPR